MEYKLLGRTSLRVSTLCFGALTMGPLQARLPLSVGASLMRCAFEQGVNFLDTAQLYQTYPYIREALKNWHKEVVIATKSYDYTKEGMADSVEEARRELDRDVIDIFLLHEQESIHTFRGHAPAFEYLLEAKAKGIVRAVGISTHSVGMVETAASIPEIDVIHPLYNRQSLGMIDGTAETMSRAIEVAGLQGKGIYAMKALGGGHLNRSAAAEFAYVLSHPHVQAVAVGMKSEAEVKMNTALFSGQPVAECVAAAVKAEPRQLHIESWCTGCGTCVRQCPAGALEIQNQRAVPDRSRCVFCGYCGAHCPDFCIKVV